MYSLTSRPALLLGAALPALLLLGACSQTAPPAAQSVTLSGHIEHPTGPRVRLALFHHPLHLGSDTASARLDAQGNFRLTLPQVAAAGEAEFSDGNETAPLFLEPGDSLHLTLDTGKFDETLTYTGRGAAANNYLIQHYLRFDDETSPMAFVAGQTPAQMSERVAANEQQRRELWQQHAAQHPVTPAFRSYMRHNLTYSAANQRLMCAFFYRYVQQEDAKMPPLPAEFLAGLKPLAAPNDSALSSSAYTEFMQGYAREQLQKANSALAKAEPNAQFQPLFKQVAQDYGSSQTRDVVLAQLLLLELQMGSLGNVQQQLPAFRALNRDSLAARKICELYTRRLALAPGQPAPAFSLHDEAGKPVALQDFRGKVVYLDFWASWCGPCLAEVPAAKDLKKQFAGRDVVFLYVSIDERDQDWQKMLTKQRLLGPGSVHLRAEGFESATAKAYQISGIPSYFIIGRDGRIVADQAPRPSSGPVVTQALEAALAAPTPAAAVAAR
jgi:thiol-disulfide isomerase/thioredoxin